MLTTDDLARLRHALDSAVHGTFVYSDELREMLRVYEAVLGAPEVRVGSEYGRVSNLIVGDRSAIGAMHGQFAYLVPLATGKGESNG